jgi:hypothetical protein
MASWLTGICEPRIFELHEWGPSVVTDATEFEPLYNGAEGCWFDTSLSWIVYASHEASISFAGTIRSSVESLVPESPRARGDHSHRSSRTEVDLYRHGNMGDRDLRQRRCCRFGRAIITDL